MVQLQTEILSRFMSKKEMDELVKKYRSSFKGGGGNRWENFEAPLKRQEKEALKYVYFDERPLSDINETLGRKRPDNVINQRAMRTATKILWQNRDKIDIKKILAGGE